MTDTRVTQGVALSAYEADADARVTQEVALATYVLAAPARVTQSVALAAYGMLAPARITQAAILALYSGADCYTTRAQCWKVTRLDGEIFAYTSHDEPITYRGTTYIPCDSLRGTASSGGIKAGTESGDFEMVGIISDSGITEEDLANGLFDGASVEVWLVPWGANATQIPRRLSKGIVARLEHSPVRYNATVETPGIKLTQSPLLTTYTPACRWDLGSTQCGVVLDSTYLVSGSVTALFARESLNSVTYRQFYDSALTESNGYLNYGTLTWTSGNNVGLSAEVKTYYNDVIELWDIMPHEIQVGDTYEVYPGCAKDVTDCTTKFNNLVNFGGFPNVPGRDSIYETPDAK